MRNCLPDEVGIKPYDEVSRENPKGNFHHREEHPRHQSWKRVSPGGVKSETSLLIVDRKFANGHGKNSIS